MHDAVQVQIDKEMNNIISDNLRKVNEQSRNFVKDVITLINKEIGINKILSILLFGSQISKNKENSKISDCDLLLIFKDRVSNRHIKEIEHYFAALEIKHNFRENKTDLINRILRIVQKSTGMYISHFLTKKHYWIQAKFHKIFCVNKVFSFLIAPRNIVLGNVILNSAILFGEDLRNNIKSKIHITFLEMIRSTIMNLMLSIFSMGLALFKINPIKYQLEAIKWSLRASNYYCYRDSESLKIITERFISFEKPKFQKKSRRFYNEFLYLRKNPLKVLNFMVRCPIRILKIHIQSIFYKKAIKRKESLRFPKKFIEPIIPERTFPLKY